MFSCISVLHYKSYFLCISVQESCINDLSINVPPQGVVILEKCHDNYRNDDFVVLFL